jgi:hypothetical protein
MDRNRIAPLALALLMVGGLILVAGCNQPNHDPVITAVNATPSDHVELGGTVNLSVVATDEDNDPLTFAWQAAGGTLSASTGTSVVWTAPNTEGSYSVTVSATDGREGLATMDRGLIAYQIWHASDMQGFTADTTYLPANATTYIPFVLEDPMPNGALIDSMFVTTDLEPDGEYENFRIWIVSPGGTEVLIYDGLNGEPDVDDFQIPAVKGETAKGDWRLKVTRGASTVERYADECSIEVHYRY